MVQWPIVMNKKQRYKVKLESKKYERFEEKKNENVSHGIRFGDSGWSYFFSKLVKMMVPRLYKLQQIIILHVIIHIFHMLLRSYRRYVRKCIPGVIWWITINPLDLSWFGQGNYHIYPRLYSSSICGFVSLAFTTLKNLHQKSDNSPKILMKSTKNYINYDLFSGELCSQDCCWRWKLCLRKLKKCITW